ncbi:MAG: RpiB/LacA/LacB family sugar-phosphate isomerase [bacterium]
MSADERTIAEVVRRVLAAVDAREGRAGTTPPAAPGDAKVVASPAGVPAPWPPRRIAVGADHGGFERKEQVRQWLVAAGYEVVDCGTSGPQSVDYPDFAAAVARQVAAGKCQAGVIVDGAGIGSGMAANKIRGVRCAVAWNIDSVRNAREHNDANVLSFGAGFVPFALARRMVELFVRTPCGGGRHEKRVAKIMELER